MKVLVSNPSRAAEYREERYRIEHGRSKRKEEETVPYRKMTKKK